MKSFARNHSGGCPMVIPQRHPGAWHWPFLLRPHNIVLEHLETCMKTSKSWNSGCSEHLPFVHGLCKRWPMPSLACFAFASPHVRPPSPSPSPGHFAWRKRWRWRLRLRARFANTWRRRWRWRLRLRAFRLRLVPRPSRERGPIAVWSYSRMERVLQLVQSTWMTCSLREQPPDTKCLSS